MDEYKELEVQLIEGKISPDEFIKKYNQMVENESKDRNEPFEPHEHI